MQHGLWRVIAVAAALLVGGREARGQTCLGPDKTAQATMDYMVQLGTTTDADEAARRDSLQIPAVTTSGVSLVTTERTCQAALQAYNAARPGLTPATRVYVVKVGTTAYVVWSPEDKPKPGQANEFEARWVFSSKWVLLSSYTA